VKPVKAKSVFISFIAMVVLSSCTEVPEDVKSRTEAKNAALSEAQNHSDRTGEVKFISTDELQVDTEKALKEKYSNFIVSDKISINIPSEITKCDFKQVSNYCVNAEKLVDQFFDESLLDGEKPVSMPYDYTKNYTIDTYGFRNIDKKIHFFVWNNGFICFMKPPLFEEQTEGGSQQAIYHIDRNDDLSGSYLLGDKEVSVAEAVSAAQKWLDDNYAQFEPKYNIKIKTLIVRENDFGEYSYHFTAEKHYKDIPLDELIMMYENNDLSKMKYMNNKITFIMKNGTDIDYFTNHTGIIEPIEKGKLDKIVSLSSALEYLEKTFAEFNSSMEIADINLKYTLKPIYDLNNGQPYNAEGVDITGKIVWEFVIDVPYNSIKHTFPNAGSVRKYIYVDAETGEMDFYFELDKLLQ